MKRAATILLIFSLTICNALGQVINLKKNWRFRIGDELAWAATDYDDSRWDMIRVPSHWEDDGFNGYDGFAWYRTKFDGTLLNPNEMYSLNLGFIDDCDEVYLNGRAIAFSGQFPPKFKTAYNNERKYSLPNDIINFKGQNTIAVRVFDAFQGGGIFDGKIGIFPLGGDKKLLIDLQGIWHFARTRSEGQTPDEDDWDNIMVPSPWEHQGFSRYDGFARYRKTFSLPANFTQEEVVLMLGKIDDFDKVYLNGKLIGVTNDHEPYGSSESYQLDRVYKIPKDLLKRGGSNTIEVIVEDMGNIGGIYEGRVGITTRANYERYFR
ncbi:MAG TPA: beta galactosidase jelly roll domain-containing protein [Chryseosolibacter sp.]